MPTQGWWELLLNGDVRNAGRDGEERGSQELVSLFHPPASGAPHREVLN